MIPRIDSGLRLFGLDLLDYIAMRNLHQTYTKVSRGFLEGIFKTHVIPLTWVLIINIHYYFYSNNQNNHTKYKDPSLNINYIPISTLSTL